ncbi:MAG TPA: 4'-phosphopantetheinyl transferase superfamily protein [Solirubrobacteraceae bacterium]|nr:4'-phosphopantetheinyl transferase superfamily protein [Solirubrobacteraceae bacterium]
MSARSHGPQATSAGGADRWPRGPDEPRLASGAVHVWRADLTTVGPDVVASLNAEERARAELIVRATDRRLWSSARGVLRALLARYLGGDAARVELLVGTHGKPELVSDRGQRPELFFNLSHSRNLALYACSSHAPVGVDVQALRDGRRRTGVDHVALARSAFGEREARRLSLVSPARREWEFLRAWTRHEAELKRLGRGIGIGAGGDDGAGDQPDRDGAAARPAEPCRPSWVVELDVGRRAVAALALHGEPSELQQWSWRA